MDEQHARRLERTREIEEMLGAGAPQAEPPKRRTVRRKPKLAKVIEMQQWKADRGRE